VLAKLRHRRFFSLVELASQLPAPQPGNDADDDNITSRAIFSLPWRCSPGALAAITVRTSGRSNSHEKLPDVFDWVEFGAFRWQGIDRANPRLDRTAGTPAATLHAENDSLPAQKPIRPDVADPTRR
jgi:hypothetical protein